MIFKIEEADVILARFTFFVVVFVLLTSFAFADGSVSEQDQIKKLEEKIETLQKQLDSIQQQATAADLEEMRQQLQIVAAEVEKFRSGEPESVQLDDVHRRSLGLGPSAASVYTKKQGVSLAGYGEMLYENFSEDSNEPDQIDFLRAVIYAGYRFNDRFLFNSEVEFEHATTGEGSEEKGEASVEFANIDFRAREDLTLRGGLMLVPMGFINEFHEPNVYFGARRPATETQIVPSTWRENGFGVLGRIGIIDYRAYLINGLNAAGFEASGIREGRQGGSHAKIHPAFVGRVDANVIPGFLVGGSVYTGSSGFFGEKVESAELADASQESFGTSIFELHAQYRNRGWDLRALYARTAIEDAARLNEELGLNGEEGVGKSLAGGYFQAGYDLLAGRGRQIGLTPYFRYERLNTQNEVAAGFVGDPALEQTIWTFGAEFNPIYDIVIKADYQNVDNEAGTGLDQFNLLLGYSF